MAEAKFYTYVHRRANSGVIFYVGKGTGRRASFTYDRNPYWRNVANKHGFVVEIVAYFYEETDAFEHERELIAGLRATGVKLANLTEGGEGTVGRIHSEETREKIRRAALGRKYSVEVRAKLSAQRTGKKMTPERREAQIARNNITLMNPEARKKANEANRGKFVSPETCKKISLSKIGIPIGPHSPEAIAKMRAAKLGKKASPETKAKMSAVQKARWAAIKMARALSEVVA